jgi:predicted amidohydrolase
VYRKIHLFDAEVGDGVSYRESDTVAPARRRSRPRPRWAPVGAEHLLRPAVPELYRALSRAGAALLTVPSAFTLVTGKDHWEVLLRARAIENQAYVLAPAQGGRHTDQRVTYGHALVVDPWVWWSPGPRTGEGLALAEVEPELLARVRRNLPALRHRRLE